MLSYSVRRPASPSSKPPVIVFLHGYGSNDQDLLSLATELDPRLFSISLQAPISLPMGGYAWFDLDWSEQGLRFDTQQVYDNLQTVIRELPEIVAKEVGDAGPLIVAGFSQGAAFSFGVATHLTAKLAGAVIMSGLPLPGFVPEEIPSEMKGFPILIQHGTLDPVVPFDQGRKLAEIAELMEADLEFNAYTMAHEINGQSLGDLRNWISKLLDKRLA